MSKICNDIVSLTSNIDDLSFSDEFNKFLDVIAQKHEKTNQEFEFTALQKKTFSTPEFWRFEGNLIIQGSTSAGKTLTAEMQIAHNLFNYSDDERPKVIYLAPLKALVSEKERSFNSIFPKELFPDLRIFASSSDYQQHDAALTSGNYDIGILVYEKFFSLVAQPNSKLLKNCTLVVIDELHMLSDDERGYKLEFCVEKIKMLRKSSTRIMGITTIDICADNIVTWLGEKNTKLISCSDRPVILNEVFMYSDPNTNDDDISHCIVTDRDGKAFTNDEYKFIFDKSLSEKLVYDNDCRFYQLLNILKKHPTEKIIIYFLSKNRVAQFIENIIRSSVLEPIADKYELTEPFPAIGETDMNENEYNTFKNNLINYGITYHNASLPLPIREYIEEQFRGSKDTQGHVRIIVSTETLTMGVNLPVDVMVLFDTTVGRTSGKETIKYQWYKNAVGRAGRLGIRESGISYCLCDKPEKANSYRDKFGLNKSGQNKKNIQSNLNVSFIENDEKYADEDEYNTESVVAAPYYLSLFTANDKQHLSCDSLKKIIAKGLAPKPKDSEAFANSIIETLKKKDRPDDDDLFVLDDLDDENYYDIMEYAQKLSKYVLSIPSMKRIYKRFIERPDNSPLKDYSTDSCTFLPKELADNEERHSLFFYLVFCICHDMPEIYQKTTPVQGPSFDNKSVYVECINSFMQKIKPCDRFRNIDIILNTKNRLSNMDERDLRAYYRMVVIYYWTLGKSSIEIRELIGLPDESIYHLYTQELSNLAEQVSYFIEAIGTAFTSSSVDKFSAEEKKKIRTQLFALSSMVKYGMSHDLAYLAGKQIRRISRRTLLEIGKLAKEHGCSPKQLVLCYGAEFVKSQKIHTSEEAIALLRAEILESSHFDMKSIVAKIEQFSFDAPDCNERIKIFLTRMCTRFGTKEWLDELQGLFADMGTAAKVMKESNNTYYLKLTKEKLNIFYSESSCPPADSLADSSNETTIVVYTEKDPPESIHKDNKYISVYNFQYMVIMSLCSNNEICGSENYVFPLIFSHLNQGEIFCESDRMKTICDEIQHGRTPDLSITKENNKNLSHNTENTTPQQPPFINNGIIVINNTQNNYTQTNIIYTQILQVLKQIIPDYSSCSGEEEKEQKKHQYLCDAETEIEKSGIFSTNIDWDLEFKNCVSKYSPRWESDKIRDIIKSLNDNDDMWKKICKAVYIDAVISQQLQNIGDYSPCAILFCTAIESFFNKAILPVEKELWPNHSLPNKSNLKDVQSIMLGQHAKIIYDNCTKNCKETKLSLYQETLYSLTKEFRNKVCHEDSGPLSKESIDKAKEQIANLICDSLEFCRLLREHGKNKSSEK